MMFSKLVAATGVCAIAVLGMSPGIARADTVVLTLTATIAANGTAIAVTAPGCQPTPPGSFDIVVQARSSTGEVGEGAVALGSFSTPGQGSVVIPAGTPINSFLVSVSCNGGALTGSEAFVLTAPAVPVSAPVKFTG
jgi:hypothetical protein